MVLPIELALMCRDAPSVEMPRLKYWNYQYALKQFQVKDSTYMFWARKCLNGNQTGTGKSIELIALNCLQKEFSGYGDVPKFEGHIQVVLASTILQWKDYYKQYAPSLKVCCAVGTKSQRVEVYMQCWDVLLISYNVLWRDYEYLLAMQYNSFCADEASFFKNPDTMTQKIVVKLAEHADWVIAMSATPIQRCLVDLWSIFQVFGMPQLLGTQTYFENHYTVKQWQDVARGDKIKKEYRIVGYRNVQELKQRIDPFYIRRTLEECDVELPDIVHEPIWLEMHPRQKTLYEDAKNEARRSKFKGIALQNRFHAMRKIINGTKSMDECSTEDISVKSDYIMEKLTTDLVGEKVVIFSWYKSTIRSLEERFKKAGIKYAILWGDEPRMEVRRELQRQFFEDKSLQVIIGTTAIEMGVNLHIARFMFLYDCLYNPARVTQIVGRIRRIGSTHHSVAVLPLFVTGTLDEKLWEMLNKRQAVSDFVFDEQSELFNSLNDEQLYSIITS